MRIFKRQFKGGTRWGIDYQINGRRKRILVADTRKEAQTFMEEVIENKKRIKVGLPIENNGKPIPQTTVLGRESAFRKKFGKHSLDEISKSDMEAFRDSLFKRNLAYDSIKRTMATISSFFNWAKNQKPPWFQGENPASRLFASCRATTTNPGWTKHILSFEEVKRIIDLAKEENPQRADYYLWLFLAMQRPSEAKRIRFEDFDTDKWTVTIAQTKRGGKDKSYSH